MSGRTKLLVALSTLALVVLTWLLWPRPAQPEVRPPSEPVQPLRPTSVAKADAPELASVGSIRGSVLSDGQPRKPLVGARVCAWALGHDAQIEDPLAARCTQTDARGRYELSPLEPARYQLIASAARHVPAPWRDAEHQRSWLHLGRGEQRDGVDLSLQPGGLRLAGVVEDVAGGPIAGALILATGRVGAGGPATAGSDDEGRFELWVGHGEHSVIASAPGYAHAGTSVTAPSEAIVLALVPEAVLVGRVVDARTNLGVAGIEVVPQPKHARTRVLSDADGSFRIAGLRPGRYQPQAQGEGLFGQYPGTIQLALGQTSEPIELRVHPAHRISGQLIARDLDGSERGCAVGSIHVTGIVSRSAKADDQGFVRIEGLPPGPYQLRPACPGQFDLDPIDITLDADHDEQRWVFEAGLAISGVVVDDSDRPVPGLYVDAEGPTGVAVGSSDGDGQFRLDPLRPGSYTIWLRNTPEQKLEVELGDRSVDDLRLVSAALGMLRVTLSDAEGRPMPGKWIHLSGKVSSQERTDGEGRAEFVALPAGTVRVASQFEVEPGARKQGVPVEIRVGEWSEVALQGESRVGSISGTVSEAGGPASDAWVVAGRGAAHDGYEVGPILCEQDGSFTLTELPAGTWTLRAYREGGGHALAERVEIGDRVALELEAPASLVGTVRLASGEWPTFFTVELRQGQEEAAIESSFYRSEGRFELDGLAAGAWTVQISSPEGYASEKIRLRAGEQGQLDVEFEHRVTIEARLVDAFTDEGITALEVQLVRGRRSTGRSVVPDREGRFVLRGVPIGDVSLMLVPRQWPARVYTMQSVWVATQASPAVQDIGDIPIVGRRRARHEESGELGFDYAFEGRFEADEIDEVRVVVSAVAARGPAAKAGLREGDVLTSMDGISVVGRGAALIHQLVNVGVGASVAIEREQGGPVTLIAE